MIMNNSTGVLLNSHNVAIGGVNLDSLVLIWSAECWLHFSLKLLYTLSHMMQDHLVYLQICTSAIRESLVNVSLISTYASCRLFRFYMVSVIHSALPRTEDAEAPST